MKADHYYGQVAKNYEAQRQGGTWDWEHEFVRANLGKAKTVVDVPVGTGRFLPLYQEAGIEAVGLDVSADMLSIARRKGYGEIRKGDILKLKDKADLGVCFRMMMWLPLEQCEIALGKLADCVPRLLLTVQLGKPKMGGTIVHPEQEFRTILDQRWISVSEDCEPCKGGFYYLMELERKHG